MALEPKQKLFVKYYLAHKNATKAAILAGYSKKTAQRMGSENLSKPLIAAAIERGMAKLCEKAELTAQMVLDEIRKLAFADLTRAYGPDGKLLDLHEMPDDIRAALQSVESEELFVGKGTSRVKIGSAKKIRLADKVRSLEMLGKHFKLFTDVSEVSGKDGGPIVTLTLPANGSEADKK